MSKVTIQGDASGTGIFTIASPNSNTDRTLVLPDEAGTVLTTATPGVPVNGPAFSAYQGANQAITNNTWTKLQMNTENFDTNSDYDTSTYRFTPSVAGYYQISTSIRNFSNSSISYAFVGVYKNGTGWKDAAVPVYLANYAVGGLTALVYLNGTSDYVETYAFILSGGTNTVELNFSQSNFSGALVRAA